MKPKIDSFVIAIIIVVGLARLVPGWGSEQSPLPLGLMGSIGVSMIFFFYGLKLSPEKIKTGLANWKLHVLVQLSTFLLFPLIILCFRPFVQSENAQTLWLAFLFLAALPSTVSSSVVMVSMAKGNVPAAIFNASISGLIGIVVTPLWMGLFLQKDMAGEFHLQSIYLKLLTEILLPVTLGLMLHRYGGKWALRNARWLTLFDKTVILLIIFKSFSESFEKNVFSSVGAGYFLFIALAVTALFFFVYYVTGVLANKLGFSGEDRITAQFCGTKKSLVHGTVFSKILFPGSVSAGIILLPLMLFHAIQIFIISVVAARLGRRKLSD
ncbi:MAG: bile acid:sodium symporter [Chitinophagaceae bacterium]|nr:bile acid:sodium symporter [Chitinophagaceae bacterium]